MTIKKTYITELPKEDLRSHISSGNYAINQKNDDGQYQIIYNGEPQKF